MAGPRARDFDYPTVMNQFVIRPLVFFGSVFHSLDALPSPWRTVSSLNPVIYVVNGVRFDFLDYYEVDPNLALVVLRSAAVIVVVANVLRFARGYGLTD